MIHWRVTYDIHHWYHIYASTNNGAIHEQPNGVATIFMSSDDKEKQHHFTIITERTADGYSVDQDGAMQKTIDMLTEEIGWPPANIVKF